MLDRLPAWARHYAIIFGAVFGLFIAQAIVREGGVWPFPALDVIRGAVNAAAVATAGVAVLALTTLTRQYARGADPKVSPTDPALAGEEDTDGDA